ncbi:Putative two-component system sensor kinase [Alloactinosynnema sp. L-07]|nr:Putative two-component system sensor kinase [Alloactinosynnema sp. L-07]
MTVLVAIAVLEGLLRSDLPWRAISMILSAGLVPTLLWRRSRPLLMVAIAFGACAVAPVLTGGQDPGLYVLVYVVLLPYSLFRWGSGREAVVGAAIMSAKVCVSALLGHLSLPDAIAGFVILFSAMAVGAALRYRSRARMRELDQVKLLERERLARDLHDTVAHHVSAMAIRAQAGLATAATHPDAAVDALRVIDAEASIVLDEMRAMVRTMRGSRPADLAPTRRVADLERLATRPPSVPAVEVAILGDVDSLPPSVGSAIYRLAQESITNARRHARDATRIAVRVATDDQSVHLSVRDDGDTGPTRLPGAPGYGLIGMIERADLLGGTFEAGPNPDRGWTVTAVLPRTGSAT